MSDRPVENRAALAPALVRLARPKQWAKGVFVLVGPLAGFADGQAIDWLAVVMAFVAFALASSGCYVVNDLRDREADRLHPRKQHRPIASGRVSPRQATVFSLVLFAGAIAACVPIGLLANWSAFGWTLGAVVLYIANTTAYSLGLKQVGLIDVMSLSAGFVLRVLGGCAAAAIEPSTWLLNCTFFLSMYLAFGKRFAERRTLGENATAARGVQAFYTDEMLRMVVVMTAVATLVVYAGFVQDRAPEFDLGFNVLWLTILPATFALFRSIALVERGEYDDPTELAYGDRPFQAAVILFGVVLVIATLLSA